MYIRAARVRYVISDKYFFLQWTAVHFSAALHIRYTHDRILRCTIILSLFGIFACTLIGDLIGRHARYSSIRRMPQRKEMQKYKIIISKTYRYV